MKSWIKKLLLGIASLIGWIVAGFLIVKETKTRKIMAEALVEHQANRNEFDIKSKHAKAEVSRIKKELSSEKKEAVISKFKEAFK